MTDRINTPTESQEQQALFQWARMQEGARPELALLVHVPNGGLRNKATAARLKAEGVRKGFPDIILPVATWGFHALAIELKRRGGGKASPEQNRWLEALRLQGWRAVVCHGWDEAREVIMRYLGMGGSD